MFCPPGLWVRAVDNQVSLWRTESSAHPMHSPGVLLPRGIPRFTQLSHSPTQHPCVTPFTRRGEMARCVAEQWTGLWRRQGLLGTISHSLWIAGGQLRAQSVDLLVVHRLWKSSV